jgi:hypothetical protein
VDTSESDDLGRSPLILADARISPGCWPAFPTAVLSALCKVASLAPYCSGGGLEIVHHQGKFEEIMQECPMAAIYSFDSWTLSRRGDQVRAHIVLGLGKQRAWRKSMPSPTSERSRGGASLNQRSGAFLATQRYVGGRSMARRVNNRSAVQRRLGRLAEATLLGGLSSPIMIIDGNWSLIPFNPAEEAKLLTAARPAL